MCWPGNKRLRFFCVRPLMATQFECPTQFVVTPSSSWLREPRNALVFETSICDPKLCGLRSNGPVVQCHASTRIIDGDLAQRRPRAGFEDCSRARKRRPCYPVEKVRRLRRNHLDANVHSLASVRQTECVTVCGSSPRARVCPKGIGNEEKPACGVWIPINDTSPHGISKRHWAPERKAQEDQAGHLTKPRRLAQSCPIEVVEHAAGQPLRAPRPIRTQDCCSASLPSHMFPGRRKSASTVSRQKNLPRYSFSSHFQEQKKCRSALN